MNKNLIGKIEQWFADRNLVEANPEKQMLKLIEEMGELASGIARDNKELIKDSIGDAGVVLIGLMSQIKARKSIRSGIEFKNLPGRKDIFDLQTEASRIINNAKAVGYGAIVLVEANKMLNSLGNIAGEYGFTFEECLTSAYDEIKDRKGRLVNGVFVKEEDLK